MKHKHKKALSLLSNKAPLDSTMVLPNLLANMKAHFYWKDGDGVYWGCSKSQAEVWDLKSSDVIGKTDFELLQDKAAAQQFRENDLQVMQTGRTLTIEEPVVLNNGKEAVMLSSKAPFRDAQGRIVGVCGVSIDITKEKQAEAALRAAKQEAEAAQEAAEAANQIKTDILDNLRHDIYNPLMGIIALTWSIASATNDPAMQENARHLNASVKALADLLNRILEAIRIGSHTFPSFEKKFDLKKRLEDVIALNKARALQQQIDLLFSYDNAIPRYVRGDSTRIHRIVLELVSNALTYTTAGFVKVSAELIKQQKRELIIQIKVEDTGIGIPKEKQAVIFLPFRKLSLSHEGLYKGVGLGLTMVKQLVDELDGEIYIGDKKESGTEFILIVPLTKPLLENDIGVDASIYSFNKPLDCAHLTINSSSTQAEHKPIPPDAAKRQVLLVEDEQIVVFAVQALLSRFNCTVDHAATPQAALKLLSAKKYRLMLTDIGLPEMSGYDLAKQIRLEELNTGTRIPIIGLSAHIDDERKQQCIDAGMDAVFSKPLSPEQVKELLDTFIPE